jgi:benzodiazapine receptor
MTSYIPSLTLPNFAFENPAVAILLPVLCGTATGFAISRMFDCLTKKCISNVYAASVSQTAYRTLKQPPLHPPGYVFGPVWTALYATMGYTAYRAYTTGANSMNPNTVALAKVCNVHVLNAITT